MDYALFESHGLTKENHMSKDTRKAPFPIRPSVEVMAWLQEKAVKNERSVNFVVNRLLETAKQKDEGKLI